MSNERIEKLEKALAFLVRAYAAAEHVDSACASAISTAEDTVHKAIEFEEDFLVRLITDETK